MAGWKKPNRVDTYHQEDGMNCGMGSVCMVIQFVKGDRLSSYIIAGESKRVGGSSQYVRTNKDNPTMRQAMPVLSGPLHVLGRTIRGASEDREGSGSGSGQRNLKAILERYGIDSQIEAPDLLAGQGRIFSKNKLKGVLNAANKSRPAIVGLADPPHFCACIGHAWKMVGSNLVCRRGPGPPGSGPRCGARRQYRLAARARRRGARW